MLICPAILARKDTWARRNMCMIQTDTFNPLYDPQYFIIADEYFAKVANDFRVLHPYNTHNLMTFGNKRYYV
jgi:hypothetical protein